MTTIRFKVEPENEEYFSVYGYGPACECFSAPGALCEHDKATQALIDTEGLWWVAKEEQCGACGSWRVTDSLGMVFGNQVEEVKKEMGGG